MSADTMEAFRVWRQQPGNIEALREVEALWRRTGAASEHPAVKAALETALTPKRRSQRTPRLSLALASAAIAGAIATSLAWPSLAGRTYDAGVGEQRLVRLDDGSSIRLDTDTRVRVRYGVGRRAVTLERGQAFFEVAHDAARPFVVTANDTTVRALGTRFDVRRDGEATRVTLVQGRVEVKDRAAPDAVVLAPGQQVTAKERLGAVRRVDTETATSWTTGRLTFHAVPLQQALAEINRYRRTPIRLDPAYVADTPITGTFDSGDTGAIVDSIALLRGLKARPMPDGSVMLEADHARPAG
ncbi:hypothetical protein AS593_06930 [Caulobacter vibrioides]|nr:hypothetical protein AS593_06930 [Caulobacter vibrioides]